MDIRFDDHASFHKAALGMTLGALLLGLALHPLTPFAPLAGALLGISAGAAFAHGRWGGRMLAASLAVLPLFVLTPTWGLLAASAAVLGLGLAYGGPRGVRGVLGTVVGAGSLLVAMWCALRITGARETAAWPTWITSGTAAAAAGIVGVLAMVPRHLVMSLDPVHAAARQLPGTLDPEVRELCARAIAIWSTAKHKLSEGDPGMLLVRDGVLTTLAVATKSAAVELTAAGEAEVVARMEDIDRRIAATSDAEARSQYQAARAALADQLRYRDHIRQGRERLVARMHNHVTTLEKFQLAATGLEAARVTCTTATRQLDELSQDVAASGEALAELELDVPPSSERTAAATVAPPAEPAGASPAVSRS